MGANVRVCIRTGATFRDVVKNLLQDKAPNQMRIIILYTESAALTCAIIAYPELMGNKNNMTEFILLGLTPNPRMQKVIFVVFLIIYIITMVGNLIIVITRTTRKTLDSPMAEIILLTVMAYDHYVAICKPLHYMTIMNRRVCGVLVVVVWMEGLVHATIQILFMVDLPFCGPNIIDHFLCDLNPLLNLGCTVTHTLGPFVATNSGLICLLNFVMLMISYVMILCSLKTHSKEDRCKALSTCISHITIDVLFFVPCIFMYMWPASTFPMHNAIAAWQSWDHEALRGTCVKVLVCSRFKSSEKIQVFLYSFIHLSFPQKIISGEKHTIRC
ncbi:olfactory receptor 4C46-like [Tachyglossus aculeatus]|uniref:olfactory receptor 4C46-like n=1 Tax=Tachyglossus aculeatus TaxID=9261 RepID=UPI0018F6EA23|nr:olfactory receptor 4C46-like [Tachyglossus aculeatus]